MIYRHRISKTRLKAEINIVPYIDVMLVLLVIFMVTAPFINQSLNINLPKSTTNHNDVSTNDINISLYMQKDGHCYLKLHTYDKLIINCGNLAPYFSEVQFWLKQNSQSAVLVMADRSLQYESVINTLNILREAGAQKIGLSTIPVQ